jgi:hypothetical protein
MQPVHAQAAQATTFPTSLADVPAHTRVAETFGFTPLSLSVGGFLGFAGSLIGVAMRGIDELSDLYLPGGCLVGFLLFGAWELMRRRSPTVLAFAGPQIGVYRGGTLGEVVHRSGVTIYQLSILNTIRELFFFGMVGFFSLSGGLMTLARDRALGLCVLGVGVGTSGAFVSSIYARVACRHFFIPRGRGDEHVVFAKAKIDPFGL